ncbi:pilus assembly protein CpaD [Pseudomonas sp. MAFF212427]|uniref:Pilus assembly protein CpaD n=2 Tax=Pseudomonas brassicae TaxID=2708063 RepID=A0A6B3P2M0_9PSED|nr:CpaD family pilus assembly lipoprotein [Pseudomonas brassicae]NER66608.1 pilus assembly protein CpaD [Pseudomonas brassicae]
MHAAKPLFVTLSLSLLLGACDRNVNNQRIATYAPFPENLAIQAKPSAMVANLTATGHGGLSRESLADLNTLLQRQGRVAQQSLTLRPTTLAGEQLATRLSEALKQLGARQVIVAPTQLSPSNASTADLQVVSEAVVAQIPDCHIADPSRWTVHPFMAVGPLGCANRANIAAMLADPRDLNRAQALDGGDGVAAVNAVERYQRHETVELLDIDFNKD